MQVERRRNSSSHIWKKNRNGKQLLVPRDMDGFLVWNLPDDYLHYSEDLDVQSQIAVELAEGATLTHISQMPGMPNKVAIFHLMHRNEGFREMIEFARKVRAECYHDKFSDLADSVDEGTARSHKVKSEIYKHLMSVGDRDRFGAQTKVVGDASQPVTFIVDTGIRRLEAPEAVPTEGRTLGKSEEGRESLDGLPAEVPPESDSCEAETV